MVNQFEVKLWVNQFEVKETRIEFVINNSFMQSNNFKIQHITPKMEERRMYCRLHALRKKVLSEVHSESSQALKIKRFAKTVSGWQPLNVFAKTFILDF